MEYSSKIKIIKDKKIILFNEEAVQSLNLDASGAKVMFVVTLKNETENNKDNRESSIYVVNIKGSSLESNIEMLKEYVAPEMLRSVTVNDDDNLSRIIKEKKIELSSMVADLKRRLLHLSNAA